MAVILRYFTKLHIFFLLQKCSPKNLVSDIGYHLWRYSRRLPRTRTHTIVIIVS